MYSFPYWSSIRVFPQLYKYQVDNIANKDLHAKEQNKFNQKIAPVGIEPSTSWASCLCSTD